MFQTSKLKKGVERRRPELNLFKFNLILKVNSMWKFSISFPSKPNLSSSYRLFIHFLINLSRLDYESEECGGEEMKFTFSMHCTEAGKVCLNLGSSSRIALSVAWENGKDRQNEQESWVWVWAVEQGATEWKIGWTFRCSFSSSIANLHVNLHKASDNFPFQICQKDVQSNFVYSLEYILLSSMSEESLSLLLFVVAWHITIFKVLIFISCEFEPLPLSLHLTTQRCCRRRFNNFWIRLWAEVGEFEIIQSHRLIVL